MIKKQQIASMKAAQQVPVTETEEKIWKKREQRLQLENDFWLLPHPTCAISGRFVLYA